MSWVVQFSGHDIAGAVDVTVRFAMGRGIAFSDSTHAPSGLSRWASPTQRIEIDKTGVVQSRIDTGEIVIENAPRAIGLAGALDAYTTYAWQGRDAFLYWVPAKVWADRQLVARAVLQQPIANLSASNGVTSNLRFPLRDPRSALNTVLQPKKYGGTNVAGAGVDGEADIKGKPLPVLYGIASNIPGVRVNRQLLIWQLSDGLASVLCARDGALALTLGTVRANVASMQANDPVPGTYDVVQSAGEGTFVRFGTTPVYTPTFDAAEGALEANRTHAQVWKRIRMERCGNVLGDLNAASITATDALDGHEVGFWFGEETTRLDALDAVLASLSGYEVLDLSDEWHIAKLVAPVAPAALNLRPLQPDTRMKAADRQLTKLDLARPSYTPDGSPPYRVNVQWGQNYTVMQPADFAGAADERLRDKFATQWRVETATDVAIWNPTTGAGYFPNAPELTIQTGYQPGVDGLTCPHAATEAARALALYSGLASQYQVQFLAQPTDALLPGAVVQLTYPQMGLSGGKLFRVLQAGWFVEKSKRPTASLVIGLQT